MTRRIHLSLVIHNHQPVGNFDFVFEEAYRKSYLPMIEVLEKYPGFRIGLHYTGPLRNWLVEHHPDFLPRVRAMVARGQVEILTGGYYEPILVSIPDADKRGQIQKLTQAVWDDFGYRATGAWLAERVWEPHLARHMAEAGVDYTIVDDTHFRHVGLETDEDLMGYYVTEEQGVPLKIFGTSKFLRYSIPWKPVPEVIDYLRSVATERGNRVAFMGDDGEKFGLWPGTWEHVWGGDPSAGSPGPAGQAGTVGWMETFIQACLDNQDWLTTITPADYVKAWPARGRVYLPTASYDEMTEWALPPDQSYAITHLKEQLKAEGRDDILRFIKGGFWRNFLRKYPEVNNMHKKMIRVSHKVHAMPDDEPKSPAGGTRPHHTGGTRPHASGGTKPHTGGTKQQALDHLWRGQCNCPYWHGLFGGIYLAHIRRANYEHLIRAEQLADAAHYGDAPWVRVEETDFDRDSHPELLIETDAMNCYLTPWRGGQLFEWDWKDKHFNLLNGFTRRREGYHQDLINAREQGTIVVTGSPQDEAGIHVHVVRVREPGIENELQFDWYRRVGLIDHFLHPHVTVEQFARAIQGEAGDFVSEPFAWQVEEGEEGGVTVRLYRDGGVWVGERFLPVRLEKQLRVTPGSLELPVVYTIRNQGDQALTARFGVENNFALLSGHHPDGFYRVPGHELEDTFLDSVGEVDGARSVELGHRWFGLLVRWEWDRPATLWRAPVNTISNSEAGFEKVYQASSVMPLWTLNLPPGQTWTVAMSFALASP